MAVPPNEPDRPPGTPRYLPRIVYKPPEPGPEDDAEEEDAEHPAEDGEIPLAAPPPKPLRRSRPPEEPPAPARSREAAAPRARAKGDPAPAKPSAKPKPKTSGPIDPDKPRKGVLIEETPELDTYDSRKRVRMIVGIVAASVAALSLLLIVRALKTDDEGDDEPAGPAVATAPRPPAETPAARESRAALLLSDAREHERTGKLDLALERVRRVIAELGDTPSADAARASLARHDQGLPLFVDGAAIVANKTPAPSPDPEPVEAEAPAEAPVVIATPATSMPAAPEAHEAPAPAPPEPVALAEPRRPTGVGLPRADVPPRALPPGFRARAEAGVHETGWPLEITCDRDGAAMMLVPGGTFVQGRDDGPAAERPAHQVTLDPFYIDQHEITARQFRRFRPEAPDDGDVPVTRVSLDDARAYAEWAGKSLPTEAQWEMAARATDGRSHPWGNAPSAWDRPRQVGQIDPVMSFANDLSPYGVFDLAGNAAEWTNDWFDPKLYASLAGRPVSNPTGPPQGKGRLPEVVIKGGSRTWNASWRGGMRPEAKLPNLGFRCVLNPGAGGPGRAAPGFPAPTSGPVPF